MAARLVIQDDSEAFGEVPITGSSMLSHLMSHSLFISFFFFSLFISLIIIVIINIDNNYYQYDNDNSGKRGVDAKNCFYEFPSACDKQGINVCTPCKSIQTLFDIRCRVSEDNKPICVCFFTC